MSAVSPHITRSATITATEPTVALKVSPQTLDQIAIVQPRVYTDLSLQSLPLGYCSEIR